MRPVRIKKTDWAYLLEMADTRKWMFPITLSCNHHGDVWLCHTKGYHHEKDRDYVHNLGIRALRDIVSYVLLHKPEGGRFHLTKTGIRLTLSEGGEKIAPLEIVE